MARGEQGEIVVRGDVVMAGYWSDPGATAIALHDGFLRTGDVGYVDEAGYVYLTDRGEGRDHHWGVDVYPREVEEVILDIPPSTRSR